MIRETAQPRVPRFRFSLGGVFAGAGLVLAVALIATQDAGAVFALVAAGGAGLILAALAHLFPMFLNAWAWRLLVPGRRRPTLLAMTCVVWLRESVNGLLPVARVGGEVVSVRVMTLLGIRSSAAVASLVVDLTIGIVTQLLLTLVAVLLLALHGQSVDLLERILCVVAAGIVVVIAAYFAQRAGAFQKFASLADRLFRGRFTGLIGASRRIDRAILMIYDRPEQLLGSAALQSLGWLAGGVEIWIALRFLGAPIDLANAALIEVLIQALSSAAFVIPGALGVQEGGFLVFGGLLGLAPEAALALALARRLRDLVIFGPGLFVLPWLETRQMTGRSKQSGQDQKRVEQRISE